MNNYDDIVLYSAGNFIDGVEVFEYRSLDEVFGKLEGVWPNYLQEGEIIIRKRVLDYQRIERSNVVCMRVAANDIERIIGNSKVVNK